MRLMCNPAETWEGGGSGATSVGTTSLVATVGACVRGDGLTEDPKLISGDGTSSDIPMRKLSSLGFVGLPPRNDTLDIDAPTPGKVCDRISRYPDCDNQSDSPEVERSVSGPPVGVLFNLRNPILAFGHWLSSRNGLELNKLTG